MKNFNRFNSVWNVQWAICVHSRQFHLLEAVRTKIVFIYTSKNWLLTHLCALWTCSRLTNRLCCDEINKGKRYQCNCSVCEKRARKWNETIQIIERTREYHNSTANENTQTTNHRFAFGCCLFFLSQVFEHEHLKRLAAQHRHCLGFCKIYYSNIFNADEII